METKDSTDRRRASCLAVMLTGTFVGFLLVLLVLATGGWAVYLVWVVAAVALFGLAHYLLWGRLMLRLTAGEREEEELRRQVEERERDDDLHGS